MLLQYPIPLKWVITDPVIHWPGTWHGTVNFRLVVSRNMKREVQTDQSNAPYPMTPLWHNQCNVFDCSVSSSSLHSLGNQPEINNTLSTASDSFCIFATEGGSFVAETVCLFEQPCDVRSKSFSQPLFALILVLFWHWSTFDSSGWISGIHVCIICCPHSPATYVKLIVSMVWMHIISDVSCLHQPRCVLRISIHILWIHLPVYCIRLRLCCAMSQAHTSGPFLHTIHTNVVLWVSFPLGRHVQWQRMGTDHGRIRCLPLRLSLCISVCVFVQWRVLVISASSLNACDERNLAEVCQGEGRDSRWGRLFGAISCGP